MLQLKYSAHVTLSEPAKISTLFSKLSAEKESDIPRNIVEELLPIATRSGGAELHGSIYKAMSLSLPLLRMGAL